MNKAQHEGVILSDLYGLHPFDQLCGHCTLSDCRPSNKECLQHKLLDGAPPDRDLSWRRKTEIMLEAGMRNSLGDLPIVFNLEPDRRKQNIPVIKNRRRGPYNAKL